jgi:uncharacterized protein (TIGR03663 family)
MNRWLTLGLLIATLTALALRLPQLGERPMHNDEAVNAVKFLKLWETGIYHYDPNEHHGPTLPYATLVGGWISRAFGQSPLNDTLLRVIPVAFGVGLILLLAPLASGLGRASAICAALFTALSPAMVYYSRYYIHEMLLVFFTLMVFAGGWGYAQTKHWGWLVMMGAGLGLMDATKETFVIELAALGAALVATALWGQWRGGDRLNWKAWLRARPIAAVLGVWIAVAVLLFSSFLANASGPLDSLRAYLPWVGRAGGNSPHIHPWYFYFERLFFFHSGTGPWFTEGLILVLAILGFTAALMRKGLGDANATLVRIIGFYTLSLAAAYSIISYKTPWCFLAFLHGMILLAGVGTLALWHWLRPVWTRAVAALLIVAATAQLGWQAWRDSFPYAARRQNPYVYAHTSPDILNLVELVQGVAKASPQPHQMLVKVICPDDDYWPLPWYLRDFKQIGWWSELPADPYAPAVIVSTKLQAALDQRPGSPMRSTGMFGLRPKVFLELYVETNLWQNFLASRPKPN